MKVLLVCLSLCLSVAITLGNDNCQCGKRNTGRIVGGNAVQQNEYPWMAYVGTGCGGSILTKWHILTAAQCVKGLHLGGITVSVGRHYDSSSTSKNPHLANYRIEKIIPHDEYKNKKFKVSAYDIAILVTKKQINFDDYISPVCLPKGEINLVGQKVKMLGWGSVGNGIYVGSYDLREVDIEVISPQRCKSFYDFLEEKNQLCTYTAGKDACTDDAGDPLVYLDENNGRYIQVGLVSFGNVVCASSKPSVNTNVYAFIDWIKDTISSNHPEEQICESLDPPRSKGEISTNPFY